MRRSWSVIALLWIGIWTAHSAESGVRLALTKDTAWTGEALPFTIELSAPGSFSGAASFDLPALSKTVIVKVGSPLLGSKQSGGTEVFVQTHSFVLFSQASGQIELPPIGVRFSHKKGYVGPDFEEALKTTAAEVTIRRPPGSEKIGFLVTTESLDISETWNPKPVAVQTGAVFKRTITQRATGMTGMALAAVPDAELDGIRVYIGKPEVTDHEQRGEFSGERRETITYLVQRPGELTLPAIRYDWWNPNAKKLESKTLPAVTITVTAPPSPPGATVGASKLRWYLIALALLTASVWYARAIGRGCRWLRERMDPPASRARRLFLRACRRGDVDSALQEWGIWQLAGGNFAPTAELNREICELQRRRYGREIPDRPWDGSVLADAFRVATQVVRTPRVGEALPKLNG